MRQWSRSIAVALGGALGVLGAILPPRAADGQAPAPPRVQDAAAAVAVLRPPARVEAVAEDARTILVRWDPSPDARRGTGYEVLLHGRVVATRSLQAREHDLSPGRLYCYAVLTVDADRGRSAQSPVACAQTPDVSPPTPPTRLTVSVRGPTSAAVAWGPAQDDVAVAGYELLRDGAVVAHLGPADTAAVDDGASADAEHCWTVRALDAAGNRSPAPEPSCARTPRADAPVGPGALRASWGRGADVELSWDPSPARGVIYAIVGANGKRIGLTSRTRFTVVGFGAKGPRCYAVIAVDAQNRASAATPTACVEGRAGGGSEAAPPRASGP